MSEDEVGRIIGRYKENVLDVITDEFHKTLPKIENFPIEQFSNIVNQLFGVALKRFQRIISAEGKEIDSTLASLFLVCTVEAFNKVIPLQHNFIIVIVSLKEEQKVIPATLIRKFIPGMHDCLTQGLIPILFAENMDVIKNGDPLTLEVDWCRPDNEIPECFL